MASELKTLYEVYPTTRLALMPLGIRVNDMVYASGITPIDPATGEVVAGDVVAQMRRCLEHLQTLVERAGASLDNVARGVAYVTSTEDREAADGPWVALFDDGTENPAKPAFKILVTTDLPSGHLVRLDALVLVGERRERLDLPNLSAHDPTIKIGNWVFSSRLHGGDPATGKMVEGGAFEQATQLFKNMVSLVEAAGGSKDKIVQINAFGVDESYMTPTRQAFEAAFPDATSRPAFHPLVTFVRSTSALQAEFVAVL